MIKKINATIPPITMPTIASVESPPDDDTGAFVAVALIVASAGQNGNRLPSYMVTDVATDTKAVSCAVVGESWYWKRAPEVLATPAVYETETGLV
jgi:hypothetical protein